MSILSALDPATATALACPAWCTEPADHVEETTFGIYRQHHAVFATALLDGNQVAPSWLMSITLYQFAMFDRESGEIIVEPAGVRVGRDDGDPLVVADARLLAGLVARAADVLDGGAR